MSNHPTILVAAAFAMLAGAAQAHDLPGLVAEQNSLDAATRQKFDEIAQLRRLLAERARTGEGQLEAVVQTVLRWDSDRISVCFLDGAPFARTRVAEIASAWSSGTGIRFDFGPANAPRGCETQPSDIRVSFNGSGYWSYVGSQARSIPANKQTLNLARLDHDGPLSPYERSVVLHEFGHAIGFEHEHQSPKEGCDAEFNWTYLYSSLGWTPDEVRRNMSRFDEGSRRNGLVSTAFDRQSVMLYALAPEAFLNPSTAKCYIPAANLQLSPTDLSAARYLYPVAAAPGSVPMPAAAPAAPSLSDESVQRLRKLRQLTSASR